MKVSFNRTVVNGPYGGGNQILVLLVKYLEDRGIKVSFSLDKDTDVIFLMDIRDNICTFPLRDAVSHKEKYGSKILHRVNENDAHRPPEDSLGLDQKIIDANVVADSTVFVSKYLKDYFAEKDLKPDRSSVIWNGSDRGIFNSDGYKFRKKDEPLRIITHHWSNNIYKGFPIYRDVHQFCFENPKIASFQFMGRPLNGYIRGSSVIKPKPYVEIPKVLKYNDVYLTASIAEPGGNHIMEGISCGLIPIVGYPTGSCIEYTNGFNIVFDDSEHLIREIESLYNDYDRYVEMKANTMKNFKYSSEEMADKYLEVMKWMAL